MAKIPRTRFLHLLAALLHGSQVVSVSQILRRWTEGAKCSAGRPSRWALAHISSIICNSPTLLLHNDIQYIQHHW